VRKRFVLVCSRLNQQFAERLKSVFLQTVQNPASPDGLATQKMSSGELTEKISGLWVNAKLFEKGLKLFDGKNIQSPISSRRFAKFMLLYHTVKDICVSMDILW